MPPHDAQMRSPVCKSAMDCSPPRTVQNVVAVQPRMVGSRRQSADAAFPAESDSFLENWMAGQSMRPNFSALLRLALASAPLFLQKDIQKGVVNPNLAVIFDEAQFPEAIHEETHSGSRCAN